jgi:hypothetical protein
MTSLSRKLTCVELRRIPCSLSVSDARVSNGSLPRDGRRLSLRSDICHSRRTE